MKPFIIAEIGVNHGGRLELAKRMIDEAEGADAVKFQVYKADSISVKDSPAYWDLSKEPTRSQHELFSKFDGLTREDYENLADYCKTRNIEFMATPFDLECVEWLNPLVKRWKIASADITNLPLLKAVQATGKPVIISTGAATLTEIHRAVDILKAPALLHCVLNYPTAYENAQLGFIKTLKEEFPSLTIGYSDHVQDMIQLDAAYFLGAEIIEKHFTYDKTLPGNDHYHSMDKHDLKAFLSRLERYGLMLSPRSLSIESDAIKYARRSIVAERDIQEGEQIKESDLIMKRPGTGISPVYTDNLVGMVAKRTIKKDTLLDWDMVIG